MVLSRRSLAGLAAGLLSLSLVPAQAAPSEIRVDWAT